jgi:hypothetical protein
VQRWLWTMYTAAQVQTLDPRPQFKGLAHLGSLEPPMEVFYPHRNEPKHATRNSALVDIHVTVTSQSGMAQAFLTFSHVMV